MARVCTGNTVAFGELYDLHSVRAYRLARAVCFHRDDAEQAVQEAFVSIYNSRTSFQSQRGTLSAWVLSVVRHRALDVSRNNVRDTTRRADEDALAVYAAPGDVAGHVVERSEASRVRIMLHALPDAQREVITLAFYGELTHNEIATHLSVPLGTVKGRTRLGMTNLRQELDATG
jgi:RNA polymerase sigma-70 factor (ECF subfamily)